MADLLCEYIAKVNTDSEFYAEHQNNPEQTMTDYGLSAADQQLILNQDHDAIEARCPDDACSSGLTPLITYHME